MIGYPKVVIVGRTNVGKSTLFNRLSDKERSIVFDREGITRDYVHEVITWDEKTFDLVDTGGLPLEKTKDTIIQGIRKSVKDVLAQAELLLFVCDGKNGLTEEDRRIAKIVHKAKKPTFLLINKSDNKKSFEDNLPEFFALGFKNIIPISAIHGKGTLDVLEVIVANVGDPKVEEEKPACHISLLGKPNVGKSTLMNILIDQERSIVSEIAGTTREAISEKILFHKELIKITDTAGVRRKSRVDDPVEESMVKSSLKAIRDSDIAVVMVDASSGKISDQEFKLLFYAKEQNKSVILVLNKMDIVHEYKKETLDHCLEEYDFLFKTIPIVWISCKTQKNLGAVLKEIQKVRKRLTQKFDQLEIDELIKESCIRRPMYHKKNLLRIYSVKVIESRIPTFIMYVNYPEWYKETQLGYIENVLRKKYDLLGCPLRLVVKKAAS